MDVLFQKLCSAPKSSDIQSLDPDMKRLFKRKKFILKYHPTSILFPVSVLRYVMLSAIPAMLSVASALITIVKEIAAYVARAPA